MDLEIVLSVFGGIYLYKVFRSFIRVLIKKLFRNELREYLKGTK